jgi:hypothetical protein
MNTLKNIPEQTSFVPSLSGSKILFSKCWGYCTFHNFYLNHHQIKQKECLKKACKSFVYANYDTLWIEEKKEKAIKKENKKQKKIEQTALINKVLEVNTTNIKQTSLSSTKKKPSKWEEYLIKDEDETYTLNFN